MVSQPEGFAQYPYINIEPVELTRKARGRLSVARKRFPALSLATVKTLGCITYIVFFIWQVIGLILCSIRAFETTLVARHASFQLTDIQTFPHSEELELAWLVSRIFNTLLVIMASSKVPSVLGYIAILKRLARLPSFWNLLSLYGMDIVGSSLILGLKNDSEMEIALIVAFIVEEGVNVILVGFLNFIQVNHCRKMSNGGSKVFFFFKLNIFLVFLTHFIGFLILSLQFALHIYGIDNALVISSDFMSLIRAIRKFATAILTYRIYIFHWEKLFVDNRNILCHYDYLDQFPGNSPQSYIPSTTANPA